MNLDLKQLLQINHVYVMDIKILIGAKICASELIIQRYGEEFYQRILNFLIPFFHPCMNGLVVYLYIFL